MLASVLCTSVAAIALLIPVPGSPDTKVDFSGTWEMDMARSESAHSGTGDAAVTLVMKQTVTELSIETRRSGQSETIIYKLDGSESKKPAEENGPFQWRAQWEGTKLVTETHRSVNRMTVSLKDLLSLDSQAKEMTVERTLTVQHGYTTRGTKNYSSGKDIFVKAR
ncbi:MAG: hypothetical protein WKF37_13715 [Bryobacteraceae bacterium]